MSWPRDPSFARSSCKQRGIPRDNPGVGRRAPPDRPDYIRFSASEAPKPGVFAYTVEKRADNVAG